MSMCSYDAQVETASVQLSFFPVVSGYCTSSYHLIRNSRKDYGSLNPYNTSECENCPV